MIAASFSRSWARGDRTGIIQCVYILVVGSSFTRLRYKKTENCGTNRFRPDWNRACLIDLERTQLEALSQFTSKTAPLERRVQEANLTVKGARAAKGVILEKQWLRSPLAGLVSDVRVKSVTGKGVSVEVVILEEDRLGSRN
jgi:hypothetical protein